MAFNIGRKTFRKILADVLEKFNKSNNSYLTLRDPPFTFIAGFLFAFPPNCYS